MGHHGKVEQVRCGVITVSDTRTEADDKSGALIRSLLGDAGHEVEFLVGPTGHAPYQQAFDANYQFFLNNGM